MSVIYENLQLFSFNENMQLCITITLPVQLYLTELLKNKIRLCT
jgi:hypothetical protein